MRKYLVVALFILSLGVLLIAPGKISGSYNLEMRE